MKNYAKLCARSALTGNYIEPAATVILMLTVVLSTVLLNQISAGTDLFVYVFLMSAFVISAFVCVIKFSLSEKLLRLSEKSFAKTKPSKKRTIKGGVLTAYITGLKLLHFIAFSFLPFIYSSAVYMRLKYSGTSVISLIINISGAVILFAVSMLFYGVSVQRYSKAIYYFAGSEAVTLRNAISMSVVQTKGKLFDIFIFKLSFLPWFISGVFLLPLMFVLPYYEESFIFYCMYKRK